MHAKRDKGDRSPGRGRSSRRPDPVPGPGLFHDILLAPDRDVHLAARPVVSFRDQDPGPFLGEVQRRAQGQYRLRRRGIEHGRIAELDPRGLLPRTERRRRREAMVSERWHAARPILLAGAAAELASKRAVLRASKALARTLARPGGLPDWLGSLSPGGLNGHVLLDPAAALFDPERDLDRVTLGRPGGPELWLKSSRLSTHGQDRSLRLRCSFGEEGADDASRDEAAQLAVAELARTLLPGARRLQELEEPGRVLERWFPGGVLHTQHIAYWNAPQGGALLHHDAFDESIEGGQRGVLYAQVSGKTAWLALSIEDLGLRVREFLEALDEDDQGEFWNELCPEPGAREELTRIVGKRDALLAELAVEGAGRLGPIVNRGPEFTGFLVDAGHAVVLHPGDVLLLPNHGFSRTAMHSVFCASDSPGYALSVALRERGAPRASAPRIPESP